MSSVLVSQQTIIVNGGGGALNSALSSANPGDTLIVRAGNYDGAIVRKGVTIECDAGVRFVTSVTNDHHLQILNINQGERCVIVGANIMDISQSIFTGISILNNLGTVILRRSSIVGPSPSGNLDITSCRGPVIIEGFSGPGNFARLSALVILNSSSVTVTDAIVSRIEVRHSSVSLERCKTTGAANYGGLRIISGIVSASACEFHGEAFHLNWGWIPGIELEGGSLTLSRGTKAFRGFGGTLPRPAILTRSVCTVHIDPSTQLIYQGASILGPASVFFTVVPSVEILSPTKSGSPITVQTKGQPGTATVTFLSPVLPPVRLPFGVLWVHPLSPVFDSGLIPSHGIRSLTLLVPPIAQHAAFLMQPVSLSTSGKIAMGTPTQLVIN